MADSRVLDDIAVEEWSEPEGCTIDECFTAEMVETFHLKGSAEIGWIWDGEAFSEPQSPGPTIDDLHAYAAAKRYLVETGGIIIDGTQISTDRANQSLITGAYNYAQANPDLTIKFKSAAGFVALTADQMIPIANTVAAHVQACFAAEGDVSSQIVTGAITTIAEIDDFVWPSNASPAPAV